LLAILACATLVALALSSDASGESPAPRIDGTPTWQTCEPPPDTFFYRLRAKGVSCETARQVVLHGRCLDHTCAHTQFGPWRCRMGSSVVDRAKVCHRGTKLIIARAAGD
jgi:hypothetical protein